MIGQSFTFTNRRAMRQVLQNLAKCEDLLMREQQRGFYLYPRTPQFFGAVIQRVMKAAALYGYTSYIEVDGIGRLRMRIHKAA